MGQMTNGVFFGAKLEKLNDEDDRLYDALRRWGATLIYIESADEPYHLAGFWLAIRRSDDPDVPELQTVSLDTIADTYPERHDAAVRNWGEVEAAVWGVGQRAGRPRFWIAETEVA